MAERQPKKRTMISGQTGRPKSGQDRSGQKEMLGLMIDERLLKSMKTKAENRGYLHAGEMIGEILRHADQQIPETPPGVLRTVPPKPARSRAVLYRMTIKTDLKNSLIRKAHNRNMYLSELVRMILENADKQIPTRHDPQIQIQTEAME